MSKATLPLQEQKVRHKMYKTHKGWMVAGMATVSMALPMVVMTTKASADSVPVPTNSSITTPTTDSTAVTTATGTAQNGNGQKVEVPHQNLDNAVNQANQTGVKVTQNQTTSQTVTADQSQQAQANITNDYNQQTQKVNEATKAQDWKNTTYKNDQADANQVNANNQAKINQAVQNARQEGVNAYHDTANDTTQTANIGRYDNSDYETKKQAVNQKTDETVAKLNEVTAKAHANNTVANASNDHSTLDQTVQDARSKGFTVNQEATRNVDRVTTANADQLANSIRQDYQNQNDALTLAISQYYAKAQQNLGTTDVEGFLHSLWEARRSYAVNHGNVGMTGSGSWTNFAIDNYDGMVITPRGTVHSLSDLKNGNYQIIVEHATPSKVVKYVEWGNVTPQLISGELNAGIGRDNQGDYDKYPTQKDNGTRTQTWNITPGTKFRIPGAVHMANGDVKDLIVAVRQSGNKLNSNHITVYNQDGAVNFSNVANGYNNNNRIDLEFWINNENDHTDYLWVTTIADIDVKQKFSYGSTQIIGLGGLVSVHDGVIQGSDGADLNGPSSAPNGMTVLALHENHFWMALQDDGGSAYYPMIAVFGRAGNVEPTIIPDKPTLTYYYNAFTKALLSLSDSTYSTTNLAVNTPTPETANYTLHKLTVTTQTEKGATQVNDNSDVIADGHKLLAGDALTYNIDVKNNSLPANRTDNTTSFTFTDTLPSAFTLDSYSISNGNDGGDVTQLFNYIYDPATRKFTATAKKPLLDLMNQDKTKAYILPSLHLNGRVNASGATLRNQADVLINGVKASTNVVTNTSTNSNPSKSVSVGGQDANGKTTITNDVQNFDVTFDLTDYANTTASDAIKSRGIKFTDDMTITNNAVSLNQGSIKLVDAHGNSVGGYTLNVNPTNNGYQLVVNINNAKDFLNTYGGQELHLQYTAKTNDGVTGSVKNVATENIYGSTYTTNTVITNVKDINPTKDIVVNAGDSRSIDGNTVPINSTYNYKLNSSELPASRVSVITNWGISDNIDTNHVQLTGAWKVVNNHGFTDEQGNIINAGTDITSYFDYHVGNDGNIQVTPKASFLALMNKSENKTFEQSWSAYVQVKVVKAGWVTNTFNENLNDDHDKSNEVKTFSFDPVTPEPNKDGTIGKSDSVTYTSVNNKKVTKGDTVSYELKGQDLKQYHEVINQFEATDTFDKGLSYIGYKAYLNNKDGSRVDVTSHLTQKVNGQQVTWVADAQLIKMLNSDDYNTKPGVAPTIYAFAKVLTDNNQAINNTYQLNINGKTKLSQNVKIVPTTSTLDKNESVAGKDSNGKTVITNDQINFTLPWDLTNLNPNTTAISAEQMTKGLSVTDKMTTTVPNLAPFKQGTKVSISDASGHAVDSNLYTINYDSDGLGFNVQVKDVTKFLKAYGGQKLNLTYSIKTPDGVSGTFNNQATQNEFGNITKTKVVQNNVKDINPTKDVVVNAGENVSINGETVDYNSNINYKLNSSELPANRATVVTNWSTTDGIDTKHVKPTGDWHVYTNTDFVDNQGNTIKAKTDISRYFNYNYNDKTGVVTVTPTNEYLQIMNNASNVKTAQSWSAYVQTKVIGSGWAYNSFDENLNNDLDHSNQVKTFSYEPVVPKPNKDATIGQSVSNNPVSINGKGVTKGDTISYELKGQTLPQYHDTINTFSAFDVFDTGIQYVGFKAFMNMPDGTRKDVSNMIETDVDGNTVAFVANKELINLMNSDKYNTKASVTPTIYAFAKVTADGIEKISNSYFLNINGKQDVSNIVTNKTVTSDPDKKETVAGIDSNGKTVITNDRIDYKVTWDLSQLDPNKIAVSDEQMAKGLGFEDILQSDKANTFQKGPVTIKVTDAKGKAVNVGIRLNDSNDGSSKRFVSDISNPREFLKQYGGQKLTITYSIPTQDGVNAHISNTFIQKNFGNIYTAPVVKNTVKDINPTKDIVINAGENHSINGNTVPLNSTYNYKLNSSELPANRATVVTNWTTYDRVDTNHVSLTGNWQVQNNKDFVDANGKTIKAGSNISNYFTYQADKDGSVRITPKAEFLSIMNQANNKGTAQSWSAYVQVKVVKAGWVTNTFNENLNDDHDKSNEVKTFSFDPVTPDPNKNGTIGKSDSVTYTSVNNKKVTKGDTVSYVLKGQDLKQYHEVINQFEATDTFDKGLSYIGYKAYLNNKDGSRVDVTSHLTQKVNGQQVTWVADAQLIKMLNSDAYNTKPGVAPTIYAFAKVLTDNNQAINNTYQLNINGKTKLSQNVKIVPTTSTLDKNESVAGKDSNGKTVITNDLINFTLPWDLTNLNPQTTAISAEQMAKGLSVTDKMTTTVPNLAPFKQGTKVSISDASGHAVDSNLYTINYDSDGLGFNVQVKDVAKFLKAYGGQKLNLTYSIKTPDGVSGTFNNQATQNEFGNITKTKVVQNNVKDINPTKDVVVNAGENVSINGETVDLKSDYNYKLNSSTLPANRATVVTNWSATDKLDTTHVAPTGNWKVFANTDFVDGKGNTLKARADISQYFTYSLKDGVVTVTPKKEFLDMMNLDANKGKEQSWSAYVQVKVIKSGWATNTFNENLNNDIDKSNEVKTFSFEPVNPDPKKDVALGETTSPNAQSINGALVAPGDNLTYELKGQPLPQYHEQIKSFSATDVFDEGVTYNGFKAFLNVTDANGKVTQIDVTNYLKEQKSGNSVVWTATEQLLKLLNSDAYNTKASVTPTIYAKVTVDKDKAETIDNTYFVNINNKQGQSNVVENKSTTPDPTKGDYDTDGNDIDGKNVLVQSQNEYQLNWNNAKYKGVVASDNAIKKGFYYVDDVQDDALDIIDGSFTVTDEQGNEVKGVSAHVYDSISDVPDDVSDMLKANNLTPQGKFVVYSADDPQAFFKDYVQKGINLKLSFKVSSKVDFNGEYKNKAYQVNFGQAYETNEVTNKVIKTTPTKEVKNGFGEDINGKTIARGDVLAYEVKLDLTDFVNYSLTKDQLAKGLSVSDDYDETKLNITDANKAGFIVLDKDGKAVDSAMFDLTWNDEKGTWTLNVKDPQTFLKQYGGQKLAILFFATAKKDVTGDIYNKAIQNSFGQIVETNTVVNHIPEMNPHKDAVISVDKQGSLDSHEIALGDTFNYKLDSSIRPANYGGITSEWSYTDKLDIEHDQYQGQFKVYAKRDFQLADGALIKAGSDISKFFTATYDTQTGEFKVSANQDFLAIMNLDINKATEQGWVAYVNVKRIKSGEVHNTAEESYNHEVLKTNTVTTTTPEPPAPKQPVVPQVPTSPKESPKETSKATPTVPTSYQAPTVKTPAPVANENALPQTGQSDDTILAILGITLGTIGTMTLAGAKKKHGSSFVIKED